LVVVAEDVYEQKDNKGLALQTDMEAFPFSSCKAPHHLKRPFELEPHYQPIFCGLEQPTGQDQELQERSEIKAAKHL
jgi:hypothetical protein